MARRFDVETPSGRYPVHIVSESFEALTQRAGFLEGQKRLFVVTDTVVGPLWGKALEKVFSALAIETLWISLPAGEKNKNLSVWEDCVRQMVAAGIRRDSLVIAFGGGVVGDLAGFAAASVLRGVRWVQVPTTLLAMVDSSVGGKTGVNLPSGKNLVGAFHQPVQVFANLDVLTTLPDRQFVAGLGEVVKTALICGEEFLSWLEANTLQILKREPMVLEELVARCVAAKADVVSRDELETGIRLYLNAGHTVAHGLEEALGYGTLLHGEAVAIGLVVETAWAVRAGLCEDVGLPQRLRVLLSSLGLPTQTVVSDLERGAVLQAMTRDKKGRRNQLKLPVPVAIGSFCVHSLPYTELGNLLAHLSGVIESERERRSNSGE